MNIVILHCHFERGGVTQVVENHVRFLRDCDRVDRIALLCGERSGGLSSETLSAADRFCVADFDYDGNEDSASSLPARRQRIASDITELLSGEGITRETAILHWHNHGLGKNTAAPATIRQLAESGWRILLQIHDFAEDNRPENYRRLIEVSGAANKADIDRYTYPVASQIHYATLTRTDASVLGELGVPAAQTHCLPNSVMASTADFPDQEEPLAKLRSALKLPPSARWCLYPVRGIRRKNVGEFLLLSQLTQPDQFAGLTLRPTTLVEQRSYQRWCDLASEVAPRAVFDAGHHSEIGFSENLAAADFVLSTSVAEGFGMTFLEPWLSGREVIARRLPTVTDDFRASGVKLTKLYDCIPIPGDAAWLRACRLESDEAAGHAWSKLPQRFRPQLEPQLSGADSIDFAKLTSERQIKVLTRMSTDSGFASSVMRHSQTLVEELNSNADEALILENQQVIRDQYSIDHAGESLIQIYDQLMAAPIETNVRPPLHAGVGVDTINRARPFFPCRTEVL